MAPPRLSTDPDITAFDTQVERTFEDFIVLTWYLTHPELGEWPLQY